MLLHFVFWSLLLMGIENGLHKKINNWWINRHKDSFPKPMSTVELDMDEDVQMEELRVKKTPDHTLQIKV